MEIGKKIEQASFSLSLDRFVLGGRRPPNRGSGTLYVHGGLMEKLFCLLPPFPLLSMGLETFFASLSPPSRADIGDRLAFNRPLDCSRSQAICRREANRNFTSCHHTRFFAFGKIWKIARGCFVGRKKSFASKRAGEKFVQSEDWLSLPFNLPYIPDTGGRNSCALSQTRLRTSFSLLAL